MKNKTIWIVNYYAMPASKETRLRPIKFAKYFKEKGYKVIIVASSWLHNLNYDILGGAKSQLLNLEGQEFFLIKSLPYKKSSFLRFISLFWFHLKLHYSTKQLSKPDIILHTACAPFGLLTPFTAKKCNARYLVEVPDLWPESFAAFGLVTRRNPLLKISYLIEKYIYKKAEKVIFTMEGGMEYLAKKNWLGEEKGKIDPSNVLYVNNGVDLSDFNRDLKQNNYIDEDLDDNAFFKVIYIGSLRAANKISILVDVASKLIKQKKLNLLFSVTAMKEIQLS